MARRTKTQYSKSTPGTQTQAQTQWPGHAMNGKPYPDMPTVSPTTPLLNSYGATGTAIFSGIITSEEYNPDFYWRDAIKIYEQMLRNDGQINAVRKMVELPIRRATASIVPASDDPRDIEIASFVESCLFHDMTYQTESGRIIHQKWDDILRHILMSLWFGFMPFEVNWKIEDGWVKWSRWTPLLPRTVWRWWADGDNELAGIQQWTFKDYGYEFVDIPADKLLLFVNRQEGNNFEGLSELRNAYKHWFYKTQFEKIEAIGIERNAIVPPVIQLPINFTADDVTMAQNIVQNVRANELMGVTLPPGWTFEYPRNNQNRAEQVQPSIQYHDVMIARNVLCQFINLGSAETGSYALADTQVQTFLQNEQGICEYIEDVINSDAIERLVDYNYDAIGVYPKLKFSKLQADLNVIGTTLKDLTNGSNPLIMPYPELTDWLANQLGIPTPPQSAIETIDPTSKSNSLKPEIARGDANANSTDVKGKPTPDGGGDSGAALAEQVRMLNESLDVLHVLDAVDRGLTSAEYRNR